MIVPYYPTFFWALAHVHAMCTRIFLLLLLKGLGTTSLLYRIPFDMGMG